MRLISIDRRIRLLLIGLAAVGVMVAADAWRNRGGPAVGRPTNAEQGAKADLDHAVGAAIFRKLWVAAPSSTTASNGLGPLYNARSCQHCHPRGERGLPPSGDLTGERTLALVLRLSIPPRDDRDRALLASHRVNVIPDPVYGLQLQNFAIAGHAGEGQPVVGYTGFEVALGDGEIVRLRRPSYEIATLAYGPLHPGAMISPRLAPQLAGLGLLEAVPEEQILERDIASGRPGAHLAGHANRVWSAEQNKVVLGRFGWKAGTSSLRQQIGEAFAIDMGLSNPVLDRPSGDCTERQVLCMRAPRGGGGKRDGYEVGNVILDLVTDYVAGLPPAPHRPLDTRGATLFHQIGCAACHRPSFVTRADAAALPSAQTIWPYTDLLLHDMGEGLADSRPEGLASGRQWRTAPLWKSAAARVANEPAFMLHDGRARGIKEAIVWHGGEGLAARDAFTALPRSERDLLIAFVAGL